MIIPVNYAQANARFTGTAAPTGAECTFGFDITSYPGSPADLATLFANEWDTANVEAAQATSIALTEVLVKFGPNNVGPSGSWTGSIPGTQGASGVQPNTAVLVRRATASGGRSGRGRFYLPGPPENAIDEQGLLSPGYVAARQTEIDDFHAAMAVGLAIPVLLHAPGSPVVTPTPITGLTVEARVATQRRRLRR